MGYIETSKNKIKESTFDHLLKTRQSRVILRHQKAKSESAFDCLVTCSLSCHLFMYSLAPLSPDLKLLWIPDPSIDSDHPCH